MVIVVADLLLQGLLIVLGLAMFFDPDLLISQIDLGTTPTWSDLVFALTLATVAFTGASSRPRGSRGRWGCAGGASSGW